ncbi:uncharacterized protein LOC127749498 [Frankliniella occidentalis]|uniref:Uncharacterized protein LOC127749498 n=1 Tax=Frankliniella occidentalis TaxID=133901 RepID=A0A9C6U693_FRAOC|nr:uncharacterized protein LOC127749498 [Frankliniella occidentalis]
MEQLPNDLLLTVMEYLRTEDLFACRLVCKKLGALALHPGVWRRQRCSSGRAGTGDKAVCRVLRLAPRLNKLTLRLEGRSHHVSYDRTKCAVRELELEMNASSAVLANLMIRNQEALGRLRRVALTLCDVVKAETGALCLTLATSSVLKKLEIKCYSYPPRLPFADGLSCTVHTPSLEYFQCSFQLASEGFINFVLAGHASTLKVVDLGDKDRMTARSSSTASLLAGVAHLQQLTCPLLPSMEDLAASASLTNLTLYVSSAMKQVAPAAANFLRRARHLRDVTLCYRSDDRYPADVGVDLVGALAGTGQNGVQVLNIENTIWPDDDDDGEGEGERVPYPYLEPLARALPSMPALSSLSVDVFGVPEELLEAISPDTAPALDTLRLTPEGPDRGGDRDQPECAHGWRHEDSVEKFLALNPKIKLSIRCERMSCYSEKYSKWKCQSCKQGCHMQHYRNSKTYLYCWARMFPDSELSSSNVQ